NVERDVLQAIKKEDHADEEQQMVVAGNHVLRAEIDERDDLRARARHQELLILRADVVREGRRGGEECGRAGNPARPVDYSSRVLPLLAESRAAPRPAADPTSSAVS